MTKKVKGKILNLTERIIKKVDDLGYVRPSDACKVVDMLDTIEDYLMAYKAYKTEFKEDIRYLRYLIWSMAAVGADRQGYYQKDALQHLDILKDELYEWILTKQEVKE